MAVEIGHPFPTVTVGDAKRDIGLISSFQITSLSATTDENFLVVSPYSEAPHLLDLRTVDTANQLLAFALRGLKCLREDYATAPYVDIFNVAVFWDMADSIKWTEVVRSVRVLAERAGHTWKERDFYIVVFRSRVPTTTAAGDLEPFDRAAHAEAIASGGFLKYWFGTPDQEGRNLATCVWRSPEDARKGSVGEAHKRAAGITRLLYTEWKIERLRLLISESQWEIRPWTD